MLLVREVRESDLETLLELAKLVGKGMTSFPADIETIQTRIHDSQAGFAEAEATPTGQTYFMVLEDTDLGKVVGTTAIYAGIGLGDKPFYSYKLSNIIHQSDTLDVTQNHQVLHLVNDYTGATEYGTLILHPDYRINANGAFLSRIRAMILANDPNRFGDKIMAELRGWLCPQGYSPVWRHLGKKFFGLAFDYADRLSAVTNNRFIADLMPKHCIYADLLPEEAQEALGKPHDDSAPAKKLLESEGFVYSGYVDIFDGGPSVEAHLPNIVTVRDSRLSEIGAISPDVPEANRDTESMVSTINVQGFRATRAVVQPLEDGKIAISPETAKLLQLDVGDKLRHIKFKPSKPSYSN